MIRTGLHTKAGVLLIFLGMTSSETLAKPAKQKVRRPRTVQDADWAKSSAARVATLSKTECLRELRGKQIAFDEVESAPGVLAPVRLKGELNGVRYRTDESPTQRASSPFEVFDCRLVLALHEFSNVVRANGFDEVRLFSAWRPPPKGWPADKLATRHPGALAIDVRAFVKKEHPKDREVTVLRSWTPRRAMPPCEGKPKLDSAALGDKTLRSIFCQAAQQRLFTVQLGPNYDKFHENHFHLEITPGVNWRMVL